MRLLAATVTLLILTQAAWAITLPDTLGYTIYVRGQEVGHSAIEVSRTADAVAFDSKTHLEIPQGTLDMTCRTEVDPETFGLLRFEYEGRELGRDQGIGVSVQGDSLFGYVSIGGDRVAKHALSEYDLVAVLRDFVMEHHILMGLQHAASGEKNTTIGLLFPNTFKIAFTVVHTPSVAEVESDIKAAVCDKFVVAIDGSEPYMMMFSRDRNVPVYMAFPAAYTEVFLDEFYGDSPVSRYRAGGQ